MDLNRRHWLGLAALSAAVPVAAARGPATRHVDIAGGTPAFRTAVAAIADHGLAELAAYGFPGMTVAVRSASGETARLALGQDGTGRPVQADQLFQIGSISKSLVAMALFVLAGQGKLDLDAPARSVVPELPLADQKVTLAHILSHTAGLPGDTPFLADVPGGALWSATPPGSRFSYSNAGYDMLALVVERASGLDYDAALSALVLRPLGMATAEPVIRSRDRGRYAQGLVPFGDRPWFPRGRLGEGPWLDIDRAAGSVAMTSADMLRYLAFVAGLAKGAGAPLFSPALAKRFATPVIADGEFAADSHYGNGLAHLAIGGAPVLFHTGGMLLFSSAVTVDAATGCGVFASVNIGGTGYRPKAVTHHGVELLRAAAKGLALPTAPVPVTSAKVEQAAAFAGRFVGPGGDVVTVAVSGTGLSVNGHAVRVAGPGRLTVDDPVLGDYPFDFGDRRDRFWRGSALYGRDAALPRPTPSAALAPLAGTYISNDPWISGVGVTVRGDRVVVEGVGEIRADPDGSWRFVDPDMVTERVWFDKLVGGRPERFSWSGQQMLRLRGA